ncbi:MAG TPA: HD domain-containing protein, partial [Acidiferrobacteraceae bacterium]|nr:HD domain-containing protein [Acidiferrobacteraceae bacterium]HEX19202.1 HD domain-containing protein [Acidiferrobacteraceae bacterium]
FRVAHDTYALMKKMVEDGEVDHLVSERVWSETERALGEQQPVRYFRVLRRCGALARLFPELDVLYGVPQPQAHHPEVDTGVHTMMVLAQAARLSNDTRVRFAALVHDLGKGTTPESEWPKHIGHETRSVELVKALCQRFRVPNEFRDLAVLVAHYHTHCHRALELKAKTLHDTLASLDAFRRFERLEMFLKACEADARGRTGYENQDYPEAMRFRHAYAAACSVDVGVIARECEDGGQKGEAIKEAIRQARIKAIGRVL